MKKNTYMTPTVEVHTIEIRQRLLDSSVSEILDPADDNPMVMPSTNPLDIIGGEFAAPPFKMLFNW